MCCIRAALVGGRASIALPLLVNNSQRASSIIIDDGASAIAEYIGVGMGKGEGLSGLQPPPPPPPSIIILRLNIQYIIVKNTLIGL